MSKPFSTQPHAHPALVTSDQIRAEHTAALLSLTPEQRRAIQRLQQAKQRSHFNGRFPQENLHAIFEIEAQARSRDGPGGGLGGEPGASDDGAPREGG